MSTRARIDVAELPTLAFGSRTTLWWGVVGLIVIESTVFAILIVTYFYLRGGARVWPPPGVKPPLTPVVLGLVLLLASIWPMHRANRAALERDLSGMQLWLVVGTVLSLAFAAVRGWEIDALPFRWDSHAYGSVVWTMIGLHTTHVTTSCIENLLFVALLFKGPVEDKHLVDLRLNNLYWYFVVIWWVVLAAVI